MEELFTAEEAWKGGSFEVLLYLGPHDADRIRRALIAVWGHATLEGCWLEQNAEPAEQVRILPEAWNPESANKLLGIARLPNESKCPCYSCVVTDDDGDWLYFGTPLGSLARSYPVGAYPFENGSLTWIGPVSNWLVDIARATFGEIPFDSAVTGSLGTAEVEEALRIIRGEIPAERWVGYLRREGSILAWYPPNEPEEPSVPGGAP